MYRTRAELRLEKIREEKPWLSYERVRKILDEEQERDRKKIEEQLRMGGWERDENSEYIWRKRGNPNFKFIGSISDWPAIFTQCSNDYPDGWPGPKRERPTMLEIFNSSKIQMLEDRFLRGEVSEATYLELKRKYSGRLNDR